MKHKIFIFRQLAQLAPTAAERKHIEAEVRLVATCFTSPKADATDAGQAKQETQPRGNPKKNAKVLGGHAAALHYHCAVC